MSETYAGEERRSIERAGTNFTEEQIKAAGIRAIDEASFTEGDLMRDAIKTRLGVVSAAPASAGGVSEPALSAAPQSAGQRLDEPTPAESQETTEFSLERFVKASYPKARAGLLNGEKLCTPEEIPSKEDVLAKLKTLSPEKLEVVREMKVPMLVLEPKGLSYKKFMKNLDTGTRTRNDTFLTGSRKKQFALQDKALGIKGDGAVTGWTVGIAEGAEELDGEYGYLRDLTAKWKKGAQAKKGAVLVDHTKFALMQKQAIMSRKRLDRINWSVLSRRDNNNETVCEDDGLVSGGYCHGPGAGVGGPMIRRVDSAGRCIEGDDRVNFAAYDPPVGYCVGARFRAAVIA